MPSFTHHNKTKYSGFHSDSLLYHHEVMSLSDEYYLSAMKVAKHSQEEDSVSNSVISQHLTHQAVVSSAVDISTDLVNETMHGVDGSLGDNVSLWTSESLKMALTMANSIAEGKSLVHHTADLSEKCSLTSSDTNKDPEIMHHPPSTSSLDVSLGLSSLSTVPSSSPPIAHSGMLPNIPQDSVNEMPLPMLPVILPSSEVEMSLDSLSKSEVLPSISDIKSHMLPSADVLPSISDIKSSLIPDLYLGDMQHVKPRGDSIYTSGNHAATSSILPNDMLKPYLTSITSSQLVTMLSSMSSADLNNALTSGLGGFTDGLGLGSVGIDSQPVNMQKIPPMPQQEALHLVPATTKGLDQIDGTDKHMTTIASGVLSLPEASLGSLLSSDPVLTTSQSIYSPLVHTSETSPYAATNSLPLLDDKKSATYGDFAVPTTSYIGYAEPVSAVSPLPVVEDDTSVVSSLVTPKSEQNYYLTSVDSYCANGNLEKNSLLMSMPNSTLVPSSRSPVGKGKNMKKIAATQKNSERASKTAKPKSDRVNSQRKKTLVEQVACFKCRFCPFLSLDKDGVSVHLQNEHASEIANCNLESELEESKPRIRKEKFQPKLHCPGCSNVFYAKKSLKVHLIQDHKMDESCLNGLLDDAAEKKRKRKEENKAVESYPEDQCKPHSCAKEKVAELDTVVVEQPRPVEVAGKDEPGPKKSHSKKKVQSEKGADAKVQKKIAAKAEMEIHCITEASEELENNHHLFIQDYTFTDSCDENDQVAKDMLDTSDLSDEQVCVVFDSADESTNGQKKRGRPKNSKATLPIKLDDIGSEHDKELGYKCNVDVCAVRMKSHDNIEYHRRCHSGSEFQCPECGQSFPRWRTLSVHLWRIHVIDMELYTCDICSYKTNSYSKLVNLHRRIHGNERPFLCDICGKGFKTSKQLRNHKVIHLDKRRQRLLKSGECDVCHRHFSDKRMLRVHKDTVHQKLRPYLCSYCGYAASCKSTLKMHVRQHTGEKPFKCELCEYCTADHNSLRRHKMRHSGEKPYKCPYCTYACIQSSTYKTHLKNKHPGQNDGLMFSCHLCAFRTIKKENWVTHISDHATAGKKTKNCTSSEDNPPNGLVNGDHMIVNGVNDGPIIVSVSSGISAEDTINLIDNVPTVVCSSSSAVTYGTNGILEKYPADGENKYPILASHLKLSSLPMAVSALTNEVMLLETIEDSMDVTSEGNNLQIPDIPSNDAALDVSPETSMNEIHDFKFKVGDDLEPIS